MKETNISQLVRLEVSKLGGVVWRNNQGAYKTPEGYYIKYGVCNPGGSDLIGIFKGRFLAIEVKKPGKQPTEEQANFIKAVINHGGIAGVITDPSQVKKLLENT